MSFTIGVLTCTGGRPEAYALSERWVANQTRQPDQWVVVDDVEEATPITRGQKVIRRRPFWKEGGDSTLRRNMLAGLAAMETDIIVIVEDDDYYHPNWLAYVEKWFEDEYENGIRLVGESETIYYNVDRVIWHRCINVERASLCATAFHKDILPDVVGIIKNLKSDSIDTILWEALKECSEVRNTDHVVGFKALPGRAGIGTGHAWKTQVGTLDVGLEKLKQLVGLENYRSYVRFLNAQNILLPGMKKPPIVEPPSVANPPNDWWAHGKPNPHA